ncbi:MAG: membrane protein insertion efficiency factor YidD [Ignavibacteria bacterium]|nr:membrane protein insertion efficiency factor YidD [Ignavibacteria bacterium]
MLREIPIFFIKMYKLTISPYLPSSCRFFPSCSEYGIESYKKYGFFKGTYLTFKRIIKCNPFNKGGFDPVP